MSCKTTLRLASFVFLQLGGCAGEVAGDTAQPSCDDTDPCTVEVEEDSTGCVTTALLCVDLRGDVNRDGVVDLDDPTDDDGEASWTEDAGAIFLANVDDDASSCPPEESLQLLSACHDAADDVVNGAADLADLARIRVGAWPLAPDDATGRLEISAPGASFVRLFLRRDDGVFEHWPAPHELSTRQLRDGVEIAIEATDVVRDLAIWDGLVDLTLVVDGATGPFGPVPAAEDQLQMRVAPIGFADVRAPVTRAHVASLPGEFGADLGDLLVEAGVPGTLQVLGGLTRPFVGDLFHPLTSSMPGAQGPQILRMHAVTMQSPQTAEVLQVFAALQGPDRGGLLLYDPSSPALGNAGSNLLVLPPHTHGEERWPRGRAIRVSSDPSGLGDLDPTFETFLTAQEVGPSLLVDGSWMALPVVSKLMTVVPAKTSRGWALLVADPAGTLDMLETLRQQGHGDALLFEGRQRVVSPAEISIEDLLADIDLLYANAEAAQRIDEAKASIRAATGLTDDELISVPALFQRDAFGLEHLMPSLVSGIALDETTMLLPVPFGPEIDARPFIEDAVADTLAPLGLEPAFIEDWEFHLLAGGLTNVVAVERALAPEPSE